MAMTIEDKLGHNRFNVDSSYAHIHVKDTCDDQKLVERVIMACPAKLYSQREDGSIDFPSLERLTESLVSNGADFICVLGSTSEVPCISPSEAEVMKELLMQDGVAEDKIILEDQAPMTLANFQNTAKMIDPNAPVTVITNSYHMHRSLYFAKKAGFTDLNAAPAKSDPVFYGANLMWEVVSLIDQMFPKSGKQSAPPPASSGADSMPADSSAAQ